MKDPQQILDKIVDTVLKYRPTQKIRKSKRRKKRPQRIKNE